MGLESLKKEGFKINKIANKYLKLYNKYKNKLC